MNQIGNFIRVNYCNVNKVIMNNLLSSTLKEQDQDQVITQIKSIASEIFCQELDELDFMGINLGFVGDSNNNTLKKYSYTERGMPDDRQQCQSEWISYRNFENISNGFMNKDPCSKVNGQIKIQEGLNKQTTNPSPRSMKKQNKKQSLKSEASPKDENQMKSKIKLENLDQYGFMKQTGKLKKDVIEDLYKKREKSQNQGIKPKKHFKTLEELYAEKEPLYDKYLKEKDKKIKAIYQSRVLQEHKFEEINPIPQINNNIPVEGTFEQRLKVGVKKTQQTKSKIMSSMLEGSTFCPQTNQTKKYNEVKSIVKDSWVEKKNKGGVQNSHITFKTMPQSPKRQNRFESSKYPSLQLKSTQELRKILELDDSFQK